MGLIIIAINHVVKWMVGELADDQGEEIGRAATKRPPDHWLNKKI